MIHKLKPKSEFSRNVLTLMTGTTIAQSISIAISPILTRIYTPEDFGVFALYMSIASIIAVMATGRYELAIMLPKKDEDAINIVVLSIVISFFVSFISFLTVFIFNLQITNFLGNPEISNWLYLIPITVLLTGIYQSLNYWSNRKKKYKRLATNKVIQSATTSSGNLGMGFFGYGNSGLILGGVFGQSIATLILGSIVYRKDKSHMKNIYKLKILALLKKYIDLPKINLPHAFLNVLSSNFPIILINYFFQNVATGFYSLANRVLLSPMNIVTGSYGQVFFQKISKLASSHNKSKEEIVFVKGTISKLLVYSFPIFFAFFVFSPQIFSIIFGESWKISGEYAQVLVPMLYVRFTGSIVSSIVIVYNKQKKALIIEIVNTFIRVCSLVIGGLMDNILLGLILFSISSTLITSYRLFWYIDIVKKERSVI